MSAVTFGIKSKLVAALLGTALVVTIAVGVAFQISFTRGFLGYLNGQGIARLERLQARLSAEYTLRGTWEFLRNNPSQWFPLVGLPDPHSMPGPRGDLFPLTSIDPTGAGLRIALFDEKNRFVIGIPEVPPDLPRHPIRVRGQTVGWLVFVPLEETAKGAEQQFRSHQITLTWTIGGCVVLLAAIAAIGLAKTLIAPLQRLAQATRRLGGGDYSTRVAVTSTDEVGQLGTDFNHLANTLERNEQLRRILMADVSHELRTPLAILRGEIEAIEDGIRPLSRDSLKALQSEISILNKLVNDVYDLSLADVGALAYRKVDVDVCGVVQDCFGAIHERLAQRDLRGSLALPSGAIVVFADESRIHQLVTNLLENAIRYTDPGGTIVASCRSEGGNAWIIIEDSAPGVDDEVLPRIFDRFFRVEASRNRASGGAGLGLAICRSIVEAHRGQITAAQSSLGGVLISISLPLTDRPVVP